MNTKSFDPRAWNLLAGVALLSSCGSPPLGRPADETDTDEPGDTAEAEPGDPCQTEDDCGSYYFCNNNVCVECITTGDCSYLDGLECIDYQCVPDPDLPDGQICWYDEECPEFELCVWDSFFGHGWCTPAGDPLPNCDGQQGIPTIVDPGASVLALSFVDVDADGQGELAIATETELLVFEVGVDAPTVTPREPPGLSVQALVAGQFDAQPGEDLVLLAGAEHHRYFSDGLAGFVGATVEAGPMLNPYGLIAGDFDGMALTDLLVWGAQGAVLQLDALDLPIFADPVLSAAAFDRSAPDPGLLLTGDDEMWRLFDLAGAAVASEPYIPNFPFTSAVAAVRAPGLHRYASTEDKGAWTAIRLWDSASFNSSGALTHPSSGIELAAGDFDGDGNDELATVGAEITLISSLLDGDPCLATVELGVAGMESGHAVGDHDGDGDDELAIVVASDVIVIIDGE